MRSLTVGVASTPTSRAALRWALRHAALADSGIELLHVVPSSSGPPSMSAASRLLTRTVRAVSALAPSVAVSARILRGDVVDAIASASAPATMLVVGSSRARTRLPGERSTSRAVAAAAWCPVVLVPNTDRRFASGVVLGAHDSDSGRAALRFAVTEAASTGQHLTLVRAWSQPRTPEIEPMRDDPARWASTRVLERLVAAASQVHPEVRVDVQSARGAVSGVLLTSSRGADLLVVGDARDAAGRRSGIGAVGGAALDRMISPIAVVRSGGETAWSEAARWDDAVSEGWVERAGFAKRSGVGARRGRPPGGDTSGIVAVGMAR